MHDHKLVRRLSILWSTAFLIAATSVIGCGEIRTHRQLEPLPSATLVTGIGGTLFRLNKVGDLPNAFGGRDIYGGKVDKGFAEMKLAGIDDQMLLLDVTDVTRQSNETVMDRYKPFNRNNLVNVDVHQSVTIGGADVSKPYRINLDIRKQQELTISGIRVRFLEVQPYSVRYSLEDLQP
jgi:hypothetical protein